MEGNHEGSGLNRVEFSVISPLLHPAPHSRLALRSDCVFPEFYESSTVDASVVVVAESLQDLLLELLFCYLQVHSLVKLLHFAVFNDVVYHIFVESLEDISNSEVSDGMEVST